MSIQLRDGFANETLERTLEDLLVRFIINCPEEDLSTIERFLFQVEEAHWFYQDFSRVSNPLLPQIKMKNFCSMMVEQCPSIWPWSDDPKVAIAKFNKYKANIPVRGAAMLNEKLDKLLLVKGVESNSWGFPRGKISKDESDVTCALRELKEETGFDASNYIDEDEYVERTIGGKNYKIYIIANVPEDTEFIPLVRNEIAKIEWQNINKLGSKFNKNTGGSNNYFLVKNMYKQIMNFINRAKKLKNSQAAEEELKKKATVQLKKLLGVGLAKKEVETQKQLDPGRELLNMLHEAAKRRQSSIVDPITAQNGISSQVNQTQQPPQQMLSQLQNQPQQQQQPPFPFGFPGMPPLPQGAPPFPPLPFMLPFQLPPPQQQQQMQQQFQQMFMPNPFMFPQFAPLPGNFPMPPMQQQQQQHPGISSQPSFNQSAPEASSLSKPSFNLANKRSKEANSKELLSLLQSKPADSKLEPIKRADISSDKVDKPNGTSTTNSFLRGMFDKYTSSDKQNVSVYDPQLKPTAILKREDSAANKTEQEKKITILRRPDTHKEDAPSNEGTELLNILKKKPAVDPSPSTASASTSSASEFLRILNGRSPANSSPSAPSPNSVGKFLESTAAASPEIASTKESAAFKPTILKRGEVINNNTNDLLSILKGNNNKQPKEASATVSHEVSETETDSVPKTSSSVAETQRSDSLNLLNLLKSQSSQESKEQKKKQSRRTDTSSLNLLNVLKKNEDPVDPSQSLLDLLKTSKPEKDEEQEETHESESDSDYESAKDTFETAPVPPAVPSLLETLKMAASSSSSPSPGKPYNVSSTVSDSASLLDTLKKGMNLAASPSHQSPQPGQSSSNFLLNMLHGDSKRTPSPEATTPNTAAINAVASDSSSMASKELLGLLKQPSKDQLPVAQPAAETAAHPAISGSNELLNLLKSGPKVNPPSIDAIASNSLSASQQLTDILRGSLSPPSESSPAPTVAPVPNKVFASNNNSSNELLSLLKNGNTNVNAVASSLSPTPVNTYAPTASNLSNQQYYYTNDSDDEELDFEDFDDLEEAY